MGGYGQPYGKGDNAGMGDGSGITPTGAPTTTNTSNNTPRFTPTPYGAGSYTPPSYGMTPQTGYTGLAQQMQQAFQLAPQSYAAPRTGLMDMYASPWSVLYGGPPQQTFAQMYGQDPMQGRAPPPGTPGYLGNNTNTPPPPVTPPAPPTPPAPGSSVGGAYGPGGPAPGGTTGGGTVPRVTGGMNPNTPATGNPLSKGPNDMAGFFSTANDATRSAMIQDMKPMDAHRLLAQFGNSNDMMQRYGRGGDMTGSTYTPGMFGEGASNMARWMPGGSSYKPNTPGWSMPSAYGFTPVNNYSDWQPGGQGGKKKG